MFGGGDIHRISMDTEPTKPLLNNTRALVISDPSALQLVERNSPKEDVPNAMLQGQQTQSNLNQSKKLQEDLQEIGAKIKHHEDNVKYLKNQINKLEDSILEMQVVLGKYHTNAPKVESEDPAYAESEEKMIRHIMNYENSAAALFCRMKSNYEAHASHHPLMKDVLGPIATLGKVDDANLSRLLSEYLGLETMLGVACKTYEGVRALERYNKDAFAASNGRPQNDRFLVICLEHLRPYAGELIADDPQRRLDLLKPSLINGEAPPGFLGFAVNMINIDSTNLYCTIKSGYSLRETLFYNLFSRLQVYKSREDMLNARPFIANGAISLDGGIIRSCGMYSLGHRGDIPVMFPSDSKKFNLPVNYFETENRVKETKWKKNRMLEDIQREQLLLDQAKVNYETKKAAFFQFLAESSTHAVQGGHASTPR